MSFKEICSEKGVSENSAFDMVLGEGGEILPTAGAFTGYFAEITDSALICENTKLNARAEIPFSAFQSAEFGIGSGNLWLQCTVDGSPFVFTTLRRNWKKPSAKLLLEKIGQYAEIQGMKEYNGYISWKFIFYLFK